MVGPGLSGAADAFDALIIDFIIAFFSMYFLFKDGDKLFNFVKDLIPVNSYHKTEIIEKNRGVIYATIYGGVLVGAVQAALGGLAFWYLGIPAALVLSFTMFLATIIAGPLILSIGQATVELYHEYVKSKNTWAG